ncbi:phospholipase A2 inhibitor 31 kDa subunit-like [Engystomops pustulosus]|uniref:phospholipase A2 inhibitor 31 kDa subunit-like n=1 Tax=Engystomops pustulosus TaxID=76066 RepID=UPI003AFA900F
MRLVICVFLIFYIGSVAAVFQCYSCHRKNNVTCEHEIVNCTKGDKCVIISEEYLYFNVTFRSIYKGCAGNLPCNSSHCGRINSEHHLMYNIRCCDTNLCNTQFFEMPKLGKPQGPLCPSCYKENTVDGCEAKVKIRCQNKSDKCIKYSGTVKNPDGYVMSYSIRGCITPMECRFNLKRVVALETIQQSVFECTDPDKTLM